LLRKLEFRVVGRMEELNNELSALADIFPENEFEVQRSDDRIDVSFPLPFRLELKFRITIIDSLRYDIAVNVVEYEVPLLQLVQKAAQAARMAAEMFLECRGLAEHRHLYSAHQRALDAFNKCISSDRCASQPPVITVTSCKMSNEKIDAKYTSKSIRSDRSAKRRFTKSLRCVKIPSQLLVCTCCTH
jgi:hypothetical protein